MIEAARRIFWNIEAAVALALAWLLFLALPMKRLLAVSDRIGAGGASQTGNGLLPEARRLEGMINRLARFLPRCLCFPRAMAAQLVWRRHGFSTQLRLGVRQGAGTLEAHAWVEWHETPVFGIRTDEVAYARLQRRGSTGKDVLDSGHTFEAANPRDE